LGLGCQSSYYHIFSLIVLRLLQLQEPALQPLTNALLPSLPMHSTQRPHLSSNLRTPLHQ